MYMNGASRCLTQSVLVPSLLQIKKKTKTLCFVTFYSDSHSTWRSLIFSLSKSHFFRWKEIMHTCFMGGM